MRISQRLSVALPGQPLEDRPQQEAMARAVGLALQEGGYLMVEAGTGVGKSFAYLLPALEYALRNKATVVVSTHTLTLQEQLFHKDLPVVARALEAEGLGTASTVLMKGRGNYLSKRRLQMAMDQDLQMELSGQASPLGRIAEWAAISAEGTHASLPFSVTSDAWSEVKSDPFHCLGPKCRTFESCFYHSVRKKAQGAHMVLVNHALLLSDLSLKMGSEQGVLPAYDLLIVDEAHHLPALASEHLATTFSHAQCLGLIKRLLYSEEGDPEKGKGLFGRLPTQGAGEAVRDFKDAMEGFFSQVGLAAIPSTGLQRAHLLPEGVPGVETIARPLERIERLLEEAAEHAPSEEMAMEAKGTMEECRSLVRDLSQILERGWGDEACYVVEPDASALKRGLLQAGVLKAIPLDASSLLRENLLTSARSVVFTSATLSVGSDFSYFKQSLGLDDPDLAAKVKTLLVGSPFDYRRQVTLFLPKDMPHPRREEEKYLQKCVEYIRGSLKASHGKAFVLFTSFRMLQRVADEVRGDLEELGITLLLQGEEGWDRSRLLKVFREDVDSVLFGVNSFWEGVDVPGEALSNLIITKLPFQVPEGPLVEARHARLKERGLHPFQAESLPEAVLKLKQGFGRLIRTSKDVGTVTLLDPRVTTERWGRVFLEALPACERVLLEKPGVPEKTARKKK